MDDLIKRSNAIDAIRQWVKMEKYYHPFSKGKTIPVDEAIDQLERVQAEQPSSQKALKYTGESICLYCQTVNCDGCMYEPMEGVQ